MVKLATPFRDVTCPICGGRINCRTDESVMVRHIRDEHPTASIKDLAQVLFQELKLNMPENIDKVGSEELNELLANLCLYKSTKLGLKELRRKIRGK